MTSGPRGPASSGAGSWPVSSGWPSWGPRRVQPGAGHRPAGRPPRRPAAFPAGDGAVRRGRADPAGRHRRGLRLRPHGGRAPGGGRERAVGGGPGAGPRRRAVDRGRSVARPRRDRPRGRTAAGRPAVRPKSRAWVRPARVSQWRPAVGGGAGRHSRRRAVDSRPSISRRLRSVAGELDIRGFREESTRLRLRAARRVARSGRLDRAGELLVEIQSATRAHSLHTRLLARTVRAELAQATGDTDIDDPRDPRRAGRPPAPPVATGQHRPADLGRPARQRPGRHGPAAGGQQPSSGRRADLAGTHPRPDDADPADPAARGPGHGRSARGASTPAARAAPARARPAVDRREHQHAAGVAAVSSSGPPLPGSTS